MAPFYGWGSTAPTLQPLRGGSLFFTIHIYIISAQLEPTSCIACQSAF